MNSEVVIRFFDSSGYVSQQFSDLHALTWPDDLEDDVFLPSHTAYLSKDQLQNFVTPEALPDADSSKDEEKKTSEQLIKERKDKHLMGLLKPRGKPTLENDIDEEADYNVFQTMLKKEPKETE